MYYKTKPFKMYLFFQEKYVYIFIIGFFLFIYISNIVRKVKNCLPKFIRFLQKSKQINRYKYKEQDEKP